jgi:tetratricopeptide (TPR) repeat protein
VEYGNRGLRETASMYYEKAFAHRDRLSDAERFLLLGSYYQLGAHQDAAKSLAAYEQLLEVQPNNTAGLNNLATALNWMHDYVRAESLMTRAIRVGPVAPVHHENLAEAQVSLGKLEAASSTLAACVKSFPRKYVCPAL